MSFQSKFSNLGQPRKIWAISAVHGDLKRLIAMQETLFNKVSPGDRLVYTGNYMAGTADAQPMETMDEIIYFRRALLARPGMTPEDFVYLRGTQEELWNKLLRLPFTVNPRQLVDSIAKNNPEMNSILNGYGSSLDDAARAANEGVNSMTRWISSLRIAVRAHPGHENLFSAMRRAAFTDHQDSRNSNILFVHAGLDPSKPLLSQNDNFWKASREFSQITETYAPFKSVVRGFDPDRQGLKISPAAISLDGENELLCAQMSGRGDILEILAA